MSSSISGDREDRTTNWDVPLNSNTTHIDINCAMLNVKCFTGNATLTPISCNALPFLMSHMGNETKLCVGTSKLYSFLVFLFFQFSLQASLHPILSIMEALVKEPYSVTSHLLHKFSSRQPEMLLENRLLLVCNIHEENQHGCQHTPEFNYSAKPLLWGEEPSFVHIYELVVWAYFHLPETCDGLFIQRLFFTLHTCTCSCIFVLANCKIVLCGESEGWFAFARRTTSEKTCREWMQTRKHADTYCIIMHANTHRHHTTMSKTN